MILTHLVAFRFFPGAVGEQLATVTLSINTAYDVLIKNRNSTWERTQIVFTGTNFGQVIE